MKRFQYKINDQQVSLGLLGKLIPISLHEVVPGDTLQGAKEIQFNSRPNGKLIKNRTFLDVATFYVPFRLLWSEFPTFLIDGTGTLPTLNSDTSGYGCFLEKKGMHGTSDNFIVPWIRMAYTLIWNKYYRRDDETEIDPLETNTQLKYVSMKSNDFFTSEPEGTDTSLRS